jgi:hypothetical protein
VLSNLFLPLLFAPFFGGLQGVNWAEPEFRKTGVEGPELMGWTLPQSWCENPADGVLKKGYLKFRWNTEANENQLKAKLGLDSEEVSSSPSNNTAMRVGIAKTRLALEKECFLCGRLCPPRPRHPCSSKEVTTLPFLPVPF